MSYVVIVFVKDLGGEIVIALADLGLRARDVGADVMIKNQTARGAGHFIVRQRLAVIGLR